MFLYFIIGLFAFVSYESFHRFMNIYRIRWKTRNKKLFKLKIPNKKKPRKSGWLDEGEENIDYTVNNFTRIFWSLLSKILIWIVFNFSLKGAPYSLVHFIHVISILFRIFPIRNCWGKFSISHAWMTLQYRAIAQVWFNLFS